MKKKKVEIWSEERIRAELVRLDSITGFHGGELPIRFGRARTTLGKFCYTRAKPVNFYFSKYYFDDPEWPEKEALNVIRHEYAHYLDYMLNGYSSHGNNWKQCCMKVGARPLRTYSDEVAHLSKIMEDKEKEQIECSKKYKQGMKLLHPTYGTGIVKSIQGEGVNQRIEAEFPCGVKKLGLAWVEEKCKILA